MGKDYYKLLSIDKSATEEEVKKAYKKAVSMPARPMRLIFILTLHRHSNGIQIVMAAQKRRPESSRRSLKRSRS